MAERKERANVFVDTMGDVLSAHQSSIWTSMPGIVKSFNPTKMTVEVQLAIMARLRKPDKDGTIEWKKVPLLLDCPLHFQQGGGWMLTFPIAAGDECLVVFASRCIDAWWQNGGEDNQQIELRLHDLSDGFALVGVRSQVRLPAGAVHNDRAELRNDAGTVRVTLQGNNIEVAAVTQIKLTSPTIILDGAATVTGDLHVDGEITSDGNITAPDFIVTTGPNAPVPFSTHRHHIAGAGDTDPPKP